MEAPTAAKQDSRRKTQAKTKKCNEKLSCYKFTSEINSSFSDLKIKNNHPFYITTGIK